MRKRERQREINRKGETPHTERDRETAALKRLDCSVQVDRSLMLPDK